MPGINFLIKLKTLNVKGDIYRIKVGSLTLSLWVKANAQTVLCFRQKYGVIGDMKVKNTGLKGIEVIQQPLIFEPYSKTDQPRLCKE